MRLGFEVRGRGVKIGYKLGFISGIYGWTYLGEVEYMVDKPWLTWQG